jgi:hypothetical protein
MKRIAVTVLAIAVLLTSLPVCAADHLVSPSVMQERLLQAASQRAADLRGLRSVLVSPDSVSAATRIGQDGHGLADRLTVLSDEELRDLARRAALLRTDPVAGGAGKTLLIIGLVIVTLALIAWSQNHPCSYCI